MATSLHRLTLLLLLVLGLLLPGVLVGPGASDRGTAYAEDEYAEDKEDDDEKGEDEEDDDDLFGDDDFFESPTSFTPEQAEKAIARGITWLKKHQQDNGSWGEIEGEQLYGGGQGRGYPHPAGPTALGVYALLKCKVPLKDPSVRKAFTYLKKRYEKPDGTYETSMMLLAVCGTANPFKTSRAAGRKIEKLKLAGKYRGWAQKLHAQLLEKQTQRAWRYQVKGAQGDGAPGGPNDLSSTQLAALALFAADRLRIRTGKSVREDILSYSLDQQEDDGPEVVTKDPLSGKEIRRKARGFSYIKGEPEPMHGKPIGSMTACGIANVVMARHVLSDAGESLDEWNQRPDAKRVQRAIDDGIAWLEENWSSFRNPRIEQMGMYNIYWLYAIERAMDLVDKQKIGTHLWYSEMGQQLLDRQKEDGSWDTQTTHRPQAVLDTAFALLFLKRATQGQIPFPSITGGSDEAPVDNR